MNESNTTENKPSGTSNSESTLQGPEAKTPAQDSMLPRPALEKPPEGRAFLAPLPGFVWNPLRKLPPNMPCPCRSLKKFKKCCLNNLPPAVPEGLAKRYEEQIALGSLVFLTEKNADRMKDGMPAELWAEKVKELERQKAEREAPARLLIKDAWECDGCFCTNAGELSGCAACDKAKPTGDELVAAHNKAKANGYMTPEEKPHAPDDTQQTAR